MTGLKSLGLAGARQAIRNLFRRALPAEEKVSGSSSPTSTDLPKSASEAESLPPSEQDRTLAVSDAQQESRAATTTTAAKSTTAVPSSAASTTPANANANANTISTTTTTTTTSAATDSPTAAISQGDTMTSPAVCPDQTQEHLEARRLEDEDKENQNPATSHLDTITKQLDILTLNRRNGLSAKPMQSEPQADPKDEPEHDMSMFNDPVIMAERAKHLGFIGEALDMARLALRTNETPVGCVLVHNGKVIARGMNATNVTRNGTRHAEFMALSALFSYPPPNGPVTTSLKPGKLPDAKKPRESENNAADAASDGASENGSHSNLAASEQLSVDEGNEDGSKGHLYPYGQRLYPVTEITPEIIKESILYVTVEPCVMCASLLRQLGIKKVYFGAVNDKFGGTGGVFSIHANSLPIGANGQTASAHPQPKPIQYPDGGGSLGTSFPEGGGDGGNVEPGYEIEGGWGRDEAVGLLRRFYVQENGRAPIPRKKEGRAARLAAMMEKDGLVAFSESTEEQEQGSGHGDDEDNDHNRDQEQDDDDDDDDDDNHNANDNDDDSSHSNDDEELEGTLEADTTGHDGSFEKENIDPRAGRKLAQRDSLGSNTPQENKGY